MSLSSGVGFELAKEHLLPYFCGFLNDNESEVRTAAVSRIAEFAGILDTQTIIGKIVPCLKKLSSDSF